MRSAGAVLLALGAILLLTRRSTDLARTVVTVIPAIALYVLSVFAPLSGWGEGDVEGEQPWRAVVAITAILLAPIAMLELLTWLGADAGADLWRVAVFALTALLAGYAAQRTVAPYLYLLAGLAALVAWQFLWDEITHPSAGTTRWLLIVAATLLLATALIMARRDAPGAREVATVGGLAAVLPGLIGVLVGGVLGFTHGLLAPGSGLTRSGFPSVNHVSGSETFGWDLYLLIISTLLVWLGSQVRSRGLGYAGGLGILTFVVSVGAQVTRLESGRAPETSVGGWPVVLIVVGCVALVLPVLLRRDS
jgi:hypothetical protein